MQEARSSGAVRPERGLLERGAEVARGEQALDRACAQGAGSLVLVQGQAGIGKSRLLATWADDAAQRGLTVLKATGRELERDVPYGIVRQLFEPALMRVDPAGREELLAGAEAARPLVTPSAQAAFNAMPSHVLDHALLWLVTNLARDRPVALCADDLHWADVPSLRFLAYAAPRLPETPVVLLAASRSQRIGVALPFLDAMRSAPCAGDVRLQPLSDGAVESVVAAALGAAAPGFSAACAEATGGNPFLLDELLRELRERQVEPTEDEAATVLEVVPDSVRHAAGLRLARLSPIARAVAQAAAVLADTGTLHECAAVAGLKEELAAEGADELVLAEVIAPGEPLRHVHPLLRAAVASTVPPHALGAAHARAATVLRGEGAPIERVAVHLLAAPVGQGSSAAEALSAAARRALAQGAPDVAVRLLRRAIREPLTPPERAELHFELGSALAVTADGAAPAEIATAIELTALPSRRAEMFLRLGATYAAQGRHHDAASAFDRGLAILPEGHDALRRDLDASFVAAASMVAALRERSIQRMEAMLAAHSDGDARPLERGVLANQALQRAMLASPREEVVPLALRAWGDGALLAEETCDGKSWNLVTGTLSLCGELAASERVCDAVLADARERGSMLGFGTASYCRSFPRLRAGRISDAMADVAGAYEARQQGWEMFAGALTAVHAEVLIEQGEVDAAGEVLAVADDARWVGTIERPMLLHSRARLHHAAGRLEDALADWLTVGELLGESGLDVPGLLPWRPSAAVVLAQLGRRDAAADLAREAEAIARRCDVTQAIGRALRARALVEGGPEGIALFEEAVAVLERSEAGLELIEALVGYGAALRRAGRRMDARAPLARAAQLAHEGGAAALGLRAQEELRASGARPRRVQVVGAEALTPQERRVAVMAAEGRNNREIAQTLFVTPKAVEWHLGNTYRKLDIRSRKELPAALGAERGAA